MCLSSPCSSHGGAAAESREWARPEGVWVTGEAAQSWGQCVMKKQIKTECRGVQTDVQGEQD